MKMLAQFLCCLTCSLLINVFPIFSQITNKVEVPPVIPPSPDAASLGKYGNHPVSLHTGLPEISIPLFTVQSGSLQVPISLSYHASGFKVNEIASWVGLGWSLLAGGSVNRSIVNLPDEAGFWFENVKSENEITIDDYNYLQPLADKTGDGESDYYFYNFPGYSGQFVYEQNDPNNPFLIPDNPIDITYSGGFHIRDEKGNRYHFTAAENTWVAEPLNSYYATTYYLSSIISPDGADHISFTYIQDGSYTDASKSFTETIGQECLQAGPPSDGFHTTNWVGNTRTVTPLRLNGIFFENGKIEFIRDLTRSDQPDSRLQEMRIFQENGDGTFTLQKSFVFEEGYFTTPPGGSDPNNYRLKLTGLQEKNAQGTTIKSHQFIYDETTMLPNHNSLAQDWWGFYNAQNSNTSLIPAENITFLGYAYQIGNGNREPNAAAMKACVLKKITYPTGGYTEFDFEPHSYLDETSTPTMAGGLRIKEIRDYEGPGANPITKIYQYGDGYLIIPEDGLSASKQEIDFEFSTTGSGTTCSNVCNGKKMIISGRPAYDLTMLNGAPVVYAQVEVYEGSLTAPNGKQVMTFAVAVDEFDFAVKAYNNGRFQRNTSWKGGHEITNTIYKGNTSTKIKETQNGYGLYVQQQAIGTKVGWKVQREGCTPNIVSNNAFYSHLYFFDHVFLTGYKKVTLTKDIQYSSTDPLQSAEVRTDYEFNDMGPAHRQLTRKVILDSEGNTYETKYWYPADYNITVGNTSTLLANNIISIPVKEENYKNNQILAGRVNKLNDFGKPVEVHTYNTDQPQTAPTHDANTLIPSTYKKRLDITYNTATKNIQSVQPVDNLLTSYIWGYNNTLPIAEVKNAEIGPMTSNYTPPAHYAGANIDASGTDVPLAPTFDILFNQNVNPTISVSAFGPTGGPCGEGCRPPSPFLSVDLKKDGVWQQTFNCTWDTDNIGQLTLTPGTYQWFYDADVSPGGGFNGYDLDITTAYTSQRTGYKTFHTSFEEDGTTNINARTGSKVWSGEYLLNLPGENGDYKLSYWKKTGSNPWTLIEQNVTVTSGIVETMTLGTAGSIIDEVRLFPAGAVMTTYTHNPLFGITSVTDPNNTTTHYDYDDLGRLERVKDNDNNVLKTYSYHYK